MAFRVGTWIPSRRQVFSRLEQGPWLPASPTGITAGRLVGALNVALPIFAFSNAKRSGLKEALRSPVGYVLASLLTGYYLLATAAFQLAPVAEVALLLSTARYFLPVPIPSLNRKMKIKKILTYSSFA